MKSDPIPKLCHQIWKLYGVVNGEGKYYAKEELEKVVDKIDSLERELLVCLSGKWSK